MDSITHIALGAVVGEAILGKSIGKRALLLGAAAQSLPDIDVIASVWLSTSENLLAHRGFTHSFLFMAIASVFLSLLANRWYQKKHVSLTTWILFFGIQITIHLLLDACNAYGTGWFEPFSHYRVSFNILFVADPFFSFATGIGALMLAFMKIDNPARSLLIKSCLAISILYIGYAGYNKNVIENAVVDALEEKKITNTRLLTTPTPLNTWLWYVVAETDSGFYISHRSVFDNQREIEFNFFHQNKSLLDSIEGHENLKHLIRFSEGYYTVENRNDTLLFNDLRFGQITGWATPEEKFVFHFYLLHPKQNELVIQRGRFANWNSETIGIMIDRIRGN